MSSRTTEIELFFAVTGDKVEQQGMSGVFYGPNRKGKKPLQGKKSLQDVYSKCGQRALGDTSSPDSDWAP